MTMLTHTHGSLERHFDSSRRQDTAAHSAAAHLAMTARMATAKRFCKGALAIVVVGLALAALIALKAALFLGFVHYY
jgi:fatty acid desaturase